MDFGLATTKDSSTMIENICGTPFYMGIYLDIIDEYIITYIMFKFIILIIIKLFLIGIFSSRSCR